MTRPWKHPDSGFFYFRRRIPDDLRPLLDGRQVEKRSLKTRDPEEAKRRIISVIAEVDARWANLRAGPATFSERDAIALCRPVHDRWLAKWRNEPSAQQFWRTDLFHRLWEDPPRFEASGYVSRYTQWVMEPDTILCRDLESWCENEATRELASIGLKVDPTGQLKMAKAVAAAIQRASLTLIRAARGEIDTPSVSHAPSAAIVPDDVKPPLEAIAFTSLVDEWAAERKPQAKTVYEYRRVFKALEMFVGFSDALRLSPRDLIGWKTDMIAKGLAAKTIRDAKLAPVRAILSLAVDNHRLTSNPAERISIEVKKRAGTGIRSFTDEEAATILTAASKQTDPVLRWVPWVCAYTGARLSEVCQLRAKDIQQIAEIWAIKFDPEAGSLKNQGSERVVPIHPGLSESGFVHFATAVVDGPLFPTLKPDKFGARGGNGTKIIGSWVRSLGILDERVSPSHSWRHRFKTSARRYALLPDHVDALVGHVSAREADRYGEFPMKSLLRELSKIIEI